MKKQPLILLQLFIVLTTTAGCGLYAAQRAAINDFAESTVTISKIASAELVSMREDTIAMNLNSLVFSASVAPLGKLEGSFIPSDTIAAFKAVSALKTYGESLQVLVNDTQQDNLKKASENFTEGINRLPDKYGKLSKEEQGAIEQLINTGGGLIIEEMKEDYIKEIVKNSQRWVNRLVQVLADDFNEEKPGSLASVFLAYSVRSSAIANNAFYECRDVYCKETALKSFRFAQANVDRSKPVFSGINRSLEKLIEANKAIAAALESNKISAKDISEFSVNVKTLIDAVEVLNK